MKCSLKDGFINILLIIFITPSKGIEYPLFLQRSSVVDKPMNLQQFRASINRLQDLDSFPDNGDNQLHRIVKKQMATCDDKDVGKSKRSVVDFPERQPQGFRFGAGDAAYVKPKNDEKTQNAVGSFALLKTRSTDSTESGSFLRKLKDFAREKDILFLKRTKKNDPPNKTLQESQTQISEKDVEQQKSMDKLKKEKEMTEEKLKAGTRREDWKFKEGAVQGLTRKEEQQLERLRAKEELQQERLKGKGEQQQEKLRGKGEQQQEKLRGKGEQQQEKLRGKGEQQRERFRGKGDRQEERLREKGGKQQEGLREKGEKQLQRLKEKGEKQLEKLKGKGEKELERLKGKIESGLVLTKEEKRLKEEKNSCLMKEFTRIPDTYDYRYYYECESHPNGCLKLKHKRCPKGQFFSFKYLKCLKAELSRPRWKKSPGSRFARKFSMQDSSNPEDPEPSNEWLDATQSTNQRIPSEFKPKKKPALKIYHLRTKRKMDEILRNDIIESRRLCGGLHSSCACSHRHAENAFHNMDRSCESKHPFPRSFVIHINKKEKKNQITENDENENDNDEDDEESEEEDEDEEADDEDEDGEEEEGEAKEAVQEKTESKESFRDLLKSAKAAVTNRARFEDPTEIAARSSSAVQKTTSSLKSKKSNDSTSNDKKVLIDASIKVDSTISSVLKNFLKGKRKDKEEIKGLNDDYETLASLESRDRMARETAKIYQQLMQNNPRVKRYFLTNCAEREN